MQAAPSAAGGPAAASIFAAATDKKLRLLEEAASGSGLAVAAEVDAGTVLTQLVAPRPGGRVGCMALCASAVRFVPSCDMAVLRCSVCRICFSPAACSRAGGRLLIAATEDGAVRAYKLPLTPEYLAVRLGRVCLLREVLGAALQQAAAARPSTAVRL